MSGAENFSGLGSGKQNNANDEPSKTSRAAQFTFTAVGDLAYQKPQFLVDGLIESDSVGLIFGDPGCGKSFFAVDLGLSVATGAKFLGRNVLKGAVFYIAGEGHNGLVRRYRAWSKSR